MQRRLAGEKSELGGADTDDANDGAIEGSNDAALPELLANEDGSDNGQNAGEIIQSNQVECIQHAS